MGLSFPFMHLVLSFLLLHLAIAHFTSSVQPLCHENERSALLNFKASLTINRYASDDPSAYPKVKSWSLDKGNNDCCSWDGIKCNEDTGHVVELDLASSCLYGSINSTSSLFQLVHLERLNLSFNHFNFSKIPPEIINLSRLTHLRLSKTFFSGQIPAELLELSNLEVLDLSYNQQILVLQKPGLANLAEKLTNLNTLELINVDISSAVPRSLANLSSLRHLSLSGCLLQGKFPAEIFQLPNLQFLGLMYNPNLTGYLPEFQKGSLLRDLRLSSTRFSGKIPYSIENLQSLSYLDIMDSLFFGKIPPSLGNLTSLEHLNLSGNGFSGGLPTSIGHLVSLKSLEIVSCNLSGKVPASLGNLTRLARLLISGHGFSGGLPISIGNLVSLEMLAINSFIFSGNFPTSVGNLTQLTLLAIANCSFSGQNSYSLSWISNLNQLTTLILRNSSFSSLNSRSLSWIANLNQLTGLELSKINLTGEIPSELLNLTQLTYLALSFNQLAGPIPYWLVNLNKLSTLILKFNQLSGCFPNEVGNLTQLYYLDLAFNQLEGSVPSSIFELRNLVVLDLSSNNLSGTVDLKKLFLNLKSLEILALSSNKLSLLKANTMITYLQKLSVIGFGSCNLSEFPYFLHNQNQLMSLDLSSNKIAGQLPAWFLNTGTGYEYLNISHNLLTGFEQDLFVLPWGYMTTLDFSFNKLQGPLPIPPASIRSYLVSHNQMTGEIPRLICSLNGLYVLDLSFNNLSGMVPGCLGNFSVQLSVLNLKGNNFRGIIPQTLCNGTNLRLIDFSSNSLQGGVPKSLANCVKLKFLNLGDNQITDLFPSWLGTLPQLEVLVLKSNNFHGEMKEPKAYFESLELRIIDISFNRFTGNLPSKYFECWNAMKNVNASKLTYMNDILVPFSYPISTYYGDFDYSLRLSNKGIELEYEKLSNMITAIILSNNNFVGEIPISIAKLKGLRNLNISNNNLKGHIPSSLSNLKALESLDLSSNKLSGNIPQQLTELTSLEVFDVSNNHLIGPIPRVKQFNTFGNGSYDGNPGLCGEPLSKKCESIEAPSEEDQQPESFFVFGCRAVLIGYASGTIIGAVLGHIFSTRKYEWLAKTFRMHGMRKRQRQRM